MSEPPYAEYVAVYDISNDRERRAVEKTLKGFGQRIQESVFECRLRKRDLEELSRKLDGLGIKTGFIKLYRLEYDSKKPVFGATEKPSEEGSIFSL